jgi:hypothetical protein
MYSVLQKTGGLAGKPDIPKAAVYAKVFKNYIQFVCDTAVQLRATGSGINLAEIIPNWSDQTAFEAMIRAAGAEFTQYRKVVSRDVRFGCFLCDAGTVVNSKAVLAAFSNPFHLNDIVTLPPFENLEWGIWPVSPSDSLCSHAVKRTLSGSCANKSTSKAIQAAILGRTSFTLI